MKNFTDTPNFVFCALERELLTLSTKEIIEALLTDYASFSHGTEAGIKIPEALQEKRQMHSCILFSEGRRLAHRLPELGRKLILASLFAKNSRSEAWLLCHEGEEMLSELKERINAFEKEKERERDGLGVGTGKEKRTF